MQTQQTIINTPVHVKVAYDNEFRRFLLSETTFGHLQSTLKTLFSLETEFRIKFQDDENDWVLLTTDQELVYATELSGSPLRLQVKLISSDLPKAEAVSFTAAERRGRGGRGRGRGAGRGGFKSPQERLSHKSSRLSERISVMETKLSSNKLTSERERVLRWKIAKLQEKLAFVTAMKDSLPQSNENLQPQETAVISEPVSSTDDIPRDEDEEKPSCRGGRRGRGGCRRAMMEDGSDQPVRKGRKARVAPEIIANFRQCKANLRAARESGNAEEVQACLEAFHAAKATKLEALAALRAQEKASNDEQTATA
jgi:hypothetical protein